MSAESRVSSVCAECGAPLSFPLGATQVRCDQCGSGMAVGEGVALVRLDCPVCKGNFYSIDGTMGGRCPFCGAALLALTRNRILRYVVRPAAPAPADDPDAELVLLPFWRLSGLMFGWDYHSKTEVVFEPSEPVAPIQPMSVEPGPQPTRRDSGPIREFRGRVVNRLIADPATLSVGVSGLGFRAAVFPMEPLSAEHESRWRIVPSTLGLADARERLRTAESDLRVLSDGFCEMRCQRADIAAESISLVHYPFWLSRSQDNQRAWDGVNGEPERLFPSKDADREHQTAAFDELKVVELRCGHCAEPLVVRNHAVVLPCHGCDTFWVVGRDGLTPFAATYARPRRPDQGRELLWLPFWRVEASARYCGREASTAADLRSVLGVPKPPGDLATADPTGPLAYFVPAYGALRAPKLDFAARDMTRLQPLLEEGDYARGAELNCFYTPEDAARLAYVVLLQVIPGANAMRARSLRVRTGDVRLWYVPFAKDGREIENLLNGMRYDLSAFRGVGY